MEKQQKAANEMSAQFYKQQISADQISERFYEQQKAFHTQFHKQQQTSDELSQLVQKFLQTSKVQSDTNATHFRAMESTQNSLKDNIQDLSESLDSFTRHTELKCSGLSESIARNAENINHLDQTILSSRDSLEHKLQKQEQSLELQFQKLSFKQIENVIPSNGIYDQSKREKKY